ncbi:hypothetical protein [Halobacterium jilantaiense]|uniref:Uncharacterized protein n=1 Tax=Halobacterium jilantaiense TaxID=355548 RepID=A0A1I0QQE4_9EURY|nr:hypothetical protein [Halobacterium jilantaiense]SEW29403.1 hypothetical protein SAMN04487945_2825 [Halobacterium jilantaiense]
MNSTASLAPLVRNERANAALSWLVAAVVAAVAAASATSDLAWAAFAVGVLVVVAVPPVAFRRPAAMLPWEVVAGVAAPCVWRAVATTPLTADVAAYVSVAALALVVAVELDVFTPVAMTNWFAGVFVVVTTMATAGVWAIVQSASDLLFGTRFVLPAAPPLTDAQEAAAVDALMLDFAAATAVGVLAGGVFVYYVRRYADPHGRLPTEVAEVVAE